MAKKPAFAFTENPDDDLTRAEELYKNSKTKTNQAILNKAINNKRAAVDADCAKSMSEQEKSNKLFIPTLRIMGIKNEN